MPKTNVIDFMTTRGGLHKEHCFFIAKNKNDPLVLSAFLEEINASINSKRREWLLEQFDSAHITHSNELEKHLNLGIVVTKCQVTGFKYWTDKILFLERQLAQARSHEFYHAESSKSLEIFGLEIYRKLTPAEKIAKQIEQAHRQREASVVIAHRYFDILDDIYLKNKVPFGYKEKKLTVSDFILDLLMPNNGVSMMHLAAIYGDDRLLARALGLLRKLPVAGTFRLQVCNFLNTRLRLFQDATIVEYHNCTIWHCIAKNAPKLQVSLLELLKLLYESLGYGVTATQIRRILEEPIADTPEENMKNYAYKYYAVLQTETKLLLDRLHYLSRQDAIFRHQSVTAPVVHTMSLVYQAPPVADALDSVRYAPTILI